MAVPRPGGSLYSTCFFACGGCSIRFIDANAFNANEAGVPSSAEAKLLPAPLSLDLETYAKGATATMSEDALADSTKPASRQERR